MGRIYPAGGDSWSETLLRRGRPGYVTRQSLLPGFFFESLLAYSGAEVVNSLRDHAIIELAWCVMQNLSGRVPFFAPGWGVRPRAFHNFFCFYAAFKVRCPTRPASLGRHLFPTSIITTVPVVCDGAGKASPLCIFDGGKLGGGGRFF